jgi:hypothetical protein
MAWRRTDERHPRSCQVLGMQWPPVASEWNMGRVWGATWYKDPESLECKQTWLQSAEFIGRHLDEV